MRSRRRSVGIPFDRGQRVSTLHIDDTSLSGMRAAAPPADRHATSAPGFRPIRRNRGVSAFDPTRITVAMTRAFLAVEGSEAAASRRVHDAVAEPFGSGRRRAEAERALPIEAIRDAVELALMRGGHHKVARAYVLHRDERARGRRAKATEAQQARHRPCIPTASCDRSTSRCCCLSCSA